MHAAGMASTGNVWSELAAGTLPRGREHPARPHAETLLRQAAVDVVVEFADGHVTRLNNVAANQTVRVLESAGG
jgi:hypothetical protein